MADHANGIVVNVKDLILNILFRFCARYLQTSKWYNNFPGMQAMLS